MALSASVNLSVSPAELTVKSDKRVVEVTVSAAGETATGKATFPVKVTDASGRVWTVKSDDGATAVYTAG